MGSIALIIGIDEYAQAPLTSAVNDAVAFRDALLDLKLVDNNDIILLTAPVRPGGEEATRASINAILKEVHDKGSRLRRLYFFFAGHGLSAYMGASRAVTQTALIPPEVIDLEADANLLLNFDDYCHRLAHAGPAEQFFFVDACRDLAFEQRPGDLPPLGWPASPEPSADITSQAVLFGVSVGGKAVGKHEGMGVMTEHLIDALHGRGRGVALVWSDDIDQYVVTAESVAWHVRSRVLAQIRDKSQWRLQVMLPELRPTGGPLTPLRVVENPPTPSLTLTFDPESAAAATTVELTLRGASLEVPRWPPCRPSEAVPLHPNVYRIRAHSRRGIAAADPPKVDLREIGSAMIHILDEEPPPTPVEEPVPGEAVVADMTHDDRVIGEEPTEREPRGTFASVRAQGLEPGATVELIAEDPPYRRWVGGQSLEVDMVPPGAYVIRFRLGTEVYSESEFDLVAGERKSVRPGGARSPLLEEISDPLDDGAVVVSPRIGPMRASVVGTILPLLAVVPFDPTGAVFPSARPRLRSLNPAEYDDCPIRIVVAVEGSGWPVVPREVATSLTCQVLSPDGLAQDVPLESLGDEESGWSRIVHGTAVAPARSFIVRLRSSRLGAIEFAAGSLPGRITVVGLAPTPDGRLNAVQHLLRVPGRRYHEPEPAIEYERFLRELVLGQRLYGAGELLRRGASPTETPPIAQAQVLRDLLYAKWTDPILGCMAYYAWNDAVEQGFPDLQYVAPHNTKSTAQNLLTFFGDLPDARTIGALAAKRPEPQLVETLNPGELPILAQTLRILAGAGHSEARRWARYVAPESSWTLMWQPDPAAAFRVAAPAILV